MKIVYLTQSRFPSRAASLIQIQTVANALRTLGNRVIVTGARNPGARPNSDLRLVRWPDRLWAARRQRLYARQLLLRERPDVVITREPVLALLSARQGRCTVLELHGLPREGTRASRELGAVLAHPRLRRVIAISGGVREDLFAEYGRPHTGADLLVLHDGAAPGPEPAPAPDNMPARVGYFGHLYPGKGMETIVALAWACPSIQFAVFGGQPGDIEHWRAVSAGQPNLLIEGHIRHDEVRAQAERCDILIAPYARQVDDISGRDIGRWMSPLKIFEYMAAGRPIVTSDLPVLREVLTDDETAILCRPGELSDWVSAIERLAEDAALRYRLAQSARALLIGRYSWSDRAVAMIEGLPK